MGGHDDWPFGQIDLLLSFANLLLGILVILFVSMHPPAKNNPESAKPPGQMMVCIYWQGHHDVDLHGGSPDDDKEVWYRHQSGKTIDLVRDDLGTDNVPHFECQFARQLPDGRWVFNIVGFSITQPEVSVHAEIRIADEAGYHLLLERDLTIKHKQERTIAQFQLRDGKVVPGSVNEVFVPLRSAGA